MASAAFARVSLLLLVAGWSATALAQEVPCLFGDPQLPVACDDACLPAGGECVPAVAGCDSLTAACPLLESPWLTGDWHGTRTHLMENGLVLNADATQFFFGNTTGGVEREFRYGGHNDYVILADGGKLGLHKGLFIKVRAEHRYGETINNATGALLPATLLPDLPAPTDDMYLTNLLFTQALSESFVVFAGRLDILDGDTNAYASGRGKTQFSNMGFIANPAVLRGAPYCTTGAGFSVLQAGQPLWTVMVLNPTDSTRTTGMEDLFAEGFAISSEVRVPTNFFGLPGHQLVGGLYNSREYASLGQDPRIIIGNVPVARQTGTWALYYNFDQALMVNPLDKTRNWGVFGRAAISDHETNPISYFLSTGVGGHSLLSSRSADTFGLGWFYAGTSDEIAPFLTALLGGVGDGQGMELFYNIQLTKWCNVTPDLQVVVPARESFDTALVAGVRVNLAL